MSLRAEMRSGLLLGVILSGAYAAQAIGQVYATPTRSAFLTGLATPLVPIVSLILLRLSPTVENLVGVVLATIGGLLMFTPDRGQSINLGDVITLGCAVLFALHITLACHYAKRCDTHRLTALQITTAAVCLAILWTAIQVYLYFLDDNVTNILVVGEARQLAWSWRVSGEIVYLAILGTIVTYFLWTWGQSKRSPSHVAVMFSLHPVFAALIAVGVIGLNEWMGTRASIGAGLIFISVAISQLRFRKTGPHRFSRPQD
jgi:drug/metabolite transporter (DMT)-like permease